MVHVNISVKLGENKKKGKNIHYGVGMWSRRGTWAEVGTPVRIPLENPGRRWWQVRAGQ